MDGFFGAAVAGVLEKLPSTLWIVRSASLTRRAKGPPGMSVRCVLMTYSSRHWLHEQTFHAFLLSAFNAHARLQMPRQRSAGAQRCVTTGHHFSIRSCKICSLRSCLLMRLTLVNHRIQLISIHLLEFSTTWRQKKVLLAVVGTLLAVFL